MPNTNYVLPNEATQNFSAGLDQLFLYVNEQVPIFIPTLLLSIFLFFVLAGSTREYFRNGDPAILKWCAVSSVITSSTATFLTLISGLVILDVLVITYVVSFLFILVYFLTNK